MEGTGRAKHPDKLVDAQSGVIGNSGCQQCLYGLAVRMNEGPESQRKELFPYMRHDVGIIWTQ